MLISFGVFSAAGAGAGAAAGAYELISTTVLSSDTASVSFSSLPTGYKHLQIRMTARTSRTAFTVDQGILQFNSDTGTNYSWHNIKGDGSSVGSNKGSTVSLIELPFLPSQTATANNFGIAIIDILDWESTSKYKTTRTLGGVATNAIQLSSGLWRSTAAITGIQLSPQFGPNFKIGSRFSLYGIK